LGKRKKAIGYIEALEKAMPIRMNSPNAIAPAHTFTTFLIAVAAGARRFAHAGLLRTDQALPEILGTTFGFSPLALKSVPKVWRKV
jgi:hypothetical protein